MRAPRRQRRRATRGALLLALVLATALLIFFLDDLIRATRPTYAFVVTFPETPRLVPGAPVWLAGRPVGEVTGIDMLPASDAHGDHVAATVRVPQAVQSLIREDSPALLANPRLLADPVIDIYPGSPEAAVVRRGDTLRGIPRPSVDDLMHGAQAFAATFDSLVAGLRRVNALADRRALVFRDLQRHLVDTRIQLDRFAGQLRDGPLAELAGDRAIRADLARARSRFDEVGRLLREFSADTLTADRARVRPALERLRQGLHSMRDHLTAIETLLEQPAGLLPRMAHDHALADALTAARAQLDSLIAETRSNPLRFLF